MAHEARPEESVLVLFGVESPRHSPHGGRQFTTLIAPEALASVATTHGLAFEPLEGLVDPGNIQEATAFLGEVATTALPDGTRVSESITYQGYELWWAHYDQLYLQQCLPYTQYRRLLEHLTRFSTTTLAHPPAEALFRLFLEAHDTRYSIQGNLKRFPPVGVWLQVLISLLSLPVLMLTRPKIMLYTGDLFEPPHDYSFRMRLIYEELRGRNLPFVEFIRSLEPTRTMLAHAWKRRRPVIYSYAIKVVLLWIAGLGRRAHTPLPASASPEQAFKLALASMYCANPRGARWAIRGMSLLLRLMGIRAALVPAASNRTFHEVLGCRLAGVPTIGILHGAASRYYNVYDFMPEYRGTKRLSLDRYGLWSHGWKDYYLKNSHVYGPDQLQVSGPMRPLRDTQVGTHASPGARQGAPIKVLLVPGELSAPQEILPYLHALLADTAIALYLTFRPYRDAFEAWLRAHDPELMERVGPGRIFRGRRIQEDIAACDVVVGTYSTAVLEALLQLKPLAFFNTGKWGDYFDLKEYPSSHAYFAENPRELIACIKKSRDIPIEELQSLQERFFGDPYKNGSAWVVDELEKHLS